jgi:tetratricopeptide (TPR) repeat protein
MGQNASQVPSAKKLRQLPRFLRAELINGEAFNPPASKCLERSLELVPDQLEALEELFRYCLDNDQDAKAIKSAKRLLAKHPDHVPTLVAYGQLCLKRKSNAEALEALQHALHLNPLDRKLRAAVSAAHMTIARGAAEKKDIEAARLEYRAALALMDAGTTAAVHCRWAAAEFKVGETSRAEELLQPARANGTPLLVA